MTFVPSDSVGRPPGVDTYSAPAIAMGETWSDLENKRGWDAADAWTAPPVQHSRLQKPKPSRIRESLDPLAEIYSFTGNRIAEACFAVMSIAFMALGFSGGVVGFGSVTAVIFAFVALAWQNSELLFPSSGPSKFAVGTLMLLVMGASIGSLIVHVLLFAVVALALLCRSLRSPYELRIAPSGLLRFASATGSTDLRAAGIICLVRTESASTGRLLYFRVVHGEGSVTLDGREDVFARLAKLAPTAHMSKEKFDDTGD